MSRQLIIATRESPLALWQAEFVRNALMQEHPDLDVQLLGITSRGDQLLDAPLSKVGGKGLFVKELEEALLDGRADIAVHSMKDVPMEFPAGLCLGVICAREDPSDAFVSNRYKTLQALPAGSVVGTSSLRRECQLRARRPDLDIKFLRGNVNTRLRKLDEEQYAAIILAAAGLKRLELGHRITELLSTKMSLPAVGQGALGIECSADRPELVEFLKPLYHLETAQCVEAERAMSRVLGGSCQVPLGGFAEISDGVLQLRGFVATPDGSRIISEETNGKPESGSVMGEQMAQLLKEQGADEILAALALPDH